MARLSNSEKEKINTLRQDVCDYKSWLQVINEGINDLSSDPRVLNALHEMALSMNNSVDKQRDIEKGGL